MKDGRTRQIERGEDAIFADPFLATHRATLIIEQGPAAGEEYLLERAALARARGERQIVDAVTTARAKGISWQRIGELLGTSAQAAQQRYGAVIGTS